MHTPRALAARGALLGALCGAAAGLVDFALAAGRAQAFLPTGQVYLALFLCGLYGATAALALLAAGLLCHALFRASDGGALWRAAFADEPSVGRRLVAYGVAAALSLLALGLLLAPIVRQALRQYHHPGLIAALLAAAAAGMLLAAVPLTLFVAALLSPLLRLGPRASIRFTAPAGLLATAWVLGLYAGSGAVASLAFWLLRHRRATVAPTLALWAPLLLAAGPLLAHLLARRLPFRPRWLATPRGALEATVLALALPPMCLVAAKWSLVRQLDLRPFIALGVALTTATALLWFEVGAPRRRGPRWLELALPLLLPPLLLSLALSLGRLDRVRKAAVSFTGATAPLVGLLQRAADLDGDGYASILGGGDCDDFDRAIHPGAFDWPDDGVDQDCNGHQATLHLAAAAPFAPLPASMPQHPNVLLITIDALRADHLGSYGYRRPTSPRLDELARQSIRFADAWAHAPSTRYSIPAILAGRYPSAIATDGQLHWPPAILPENRMLAEMLHDRGYHTGATASYGGSGYFEPSWGIFQGFDEVDVHLKTLHSLGGDPSHTQGTSARQLADLDIEWLAKHKDQRFFFWTHFYDTHYGFVRHPDLPASNFGDREADLYDGEIRFSDYHIGRLLDALRADGLWDRTIIIITADHGDGFGEHGIPPSQRHGYHLYENETKVPLIIHVPGLAPRVVHSPVGHVDIAPTLLNLLGGRATDEPTLLGASRVGLMTGAQPDDLGGAVFQEVTYEGPSSRFNGTQKRAVVTHDWHFIRNVVPEGTRELYRRADDAAEVHDLAGSGLPAEETLSSQLAAWMDALAIPPDFARRIAGNVQTRPFAPRRPLGDRLGDWLVLDGVDVLTPTVRPGGALEVDLYLHARAPIPAGWRLFTHFTGRRMLNADHEPLENAYPLARLRPGTYLRDRIRVTLPADWPPGSLTMEVGLWQGAKRAPVTGTHATADRAVKAAELTVTP